ncbi:MAG: DUF1440 domain-containing protein [Methylobacter sp.]|uniref:DUF6789 family protein n=1 Tax=Methylobacter sp. TaxID=2051955 RepID=UPI0025856C36|nr:DUF6789 family protein [Methylobacter sp.]MCL7419679.1 DUF1440 domain-containing protein [Methylobacter sp.]
MKFNLTKTLIGGFTGTLMMTLMMQFAAPMMIGQPMDIAAMLGNMMGGVYALGMTVHILLGVVVFPLLYAVLLFRFLPGAPVVKGLLFGTGLWLLAATMVMPMAGAGFFMSEIGGIKAAMAALMGHWVYGVLLGAIAGRDACRHCSAQPHFH